MADQPERDVAAVREEIDAIDGQLVELLSRRARLAQEIGALKGRDGRPFFTPEREREIHERLKRENPGPLQNRQLIAIFREIISAARAAEQPLRAAFWGPEGTFSHVAAIQAFGDSAQFDPQESIRDVFLAVEHQRADYGVVPIENSLGGVVPESLDMFPQTNVKICSELYVPIRHCLAGGAAELAQIRRVYAGPQPAAQCRIWLAANLPGVEIVAAAPTVRGGEHARDDAEGAAILNREAADRLGLNILADRIEDNPHNRTRFLVVGFNEPAKTGRDKTTLMFNLRNQPGELYRALGALQGEGVNLLMIESRPAQRAQFEYLFFLDCVGHRSDANMARAIEALRQQAMETVILGSYPSAE